MSGRRDDLKTFYRALNTEDGKALLDELRASWGGNPMHENPGMLAYQTGLRQALEQMELYAKGPGEIPVQLETVNE